MKTDTHIYKRPVSPHTTMKKMALIISIPLTLLSTMEYIVALEMIMSTLVIIHV
jgi:hypothetical protein